MLVGIAADVADCNFGFFAELLAAGCELGAAVGGECRDVEADVLLLDDGVEAQAAGFDGCADGGDSADIEGLDEELRGLGHRDAGEVFHVLHRAIVIDFEEVDQGGRGAAGADAAEFGAEVVGGLFHDLFGFEENGVWISGHGAKLQKAAYGPKSKYMIRPDITPITAAGDTL